MLKAFIQTLILLILNYINIIDTYYLYLDGNFVLIMKYGMVSPSNKARYNPVELVES